MIIYGWWASHKFIGLVTDECPVCRRRRHFTVQRRKIWVHLYFIPFVPGLTTGHPITCQICGTVIKRRPRDYPQLERHWWYGWRVVPGWKEPPPDEDEIAGDDEQAAIGAEAATESDDPLAALARVSYRVRRPAAAATEAMAGGAMTAEQRLEYLREPFLRMNQVFQKRASEQHFDKGSGLGCLAACAVPIVPIVLANSATGSMKDVLYWTAGIVFALFTVFTLWKLHTDVRRWFTQKQLPGVVAALKPLNPKLEEIEEVIAGFKEAKLKMGSHINPREVYEAIQAASAHE